MHTKAKYYPWITKMALELICGKWRRLISDNLLLAGTTDTSALIFDVNSYLSNGFVKSCLVK